MRQQFSLSQLAEGLLRRLPDVLEKTPEMPTLVHRYLKQAAHGELRTQIDPNSLQQWSEQQEQRQHSQNRSIISAGALIAAALLFPAQEQLHWQSVNLWLSIGFIVLALRLFKRR
jgi:ubiquinone biosynthesis protein